MAERCVCCGEIIPEGRQICPICEKKGETVAKIKKKTHWRRIRMPSIGQRYFHEDFGFYRIKKIWRCKVYNAHCETPDGSHWFEREKAAIITEDGLKYTVPYFQLVFNSVDDNGKFVLPR